MYLGVIADDFTGATDIAGFLVDNGLPTTQLIGVPADGVTVDADAAVVSLKSRSSAPEEAVAQSRAALRWLKAQGCKQFFFKYCSTFDSTARGNIGPVTDALLEDIGDTFTIICPSLPVNGRTVYYGYLFVGDVLLSESGMRHHPITPMLDSNLVRLMEAQASGKARNVPARVLDMGTEAVRSAFSELRAAGIRYAVVDTLTDEHLTVLGQAVEGMSLVTGGSGLGAGIARAFLAGSAGKAQDASAAGAPPGGRAVVLSGSCSTMTNAQVATYSAKAPAFGLDVTKCLVNASGYAGEVTHWAAQQSGSSLAPLIYATTDPERLAAVQKLHGAEAASTAVEEFFSSLASLLAKEGFDHFIVAGGETSGVVVQSLGITGFHIGPQITPGVPWVRAVNAPLSLALKSGNFGDEQFFFKAQSFY